jgi:hypothetical protein
MLIDYKVEMWVRIKFYDNISESYIKAILNNSDKNDSEKLDDFLELENYSVDNILETSIWLPVEENDGQPTLEVLKDPETKIWDNVNGFNLSEDASCYNQ